MLLFYAHPTGVYPYTAMSSHEAYEMTELPTQAEFYSDLTQEACTDVDYAHAVNVWRHFGCETMRDYSKIYLFSGILKYFFDIYIYIYL